MNQEEDFFGLLKQREIYCGFDLKNGTVNIILFTVITLRTVLFSVITSVLLSF